jgi:hypothetical protein
MVTSIGGRRAPRNASTLDVHQRLLTALLAQADLALLAPLALTTLLTLAVLADPARGPR